MSINRWTWIKKLWHIYTMEYYSPTKRKAFESALMRWSRDYFTEWSKSKREKQILYTNSYIWNLERWYWWNYLQGSNGDTDIENKFMDTGAGLGRKETVGCMERVNTETYTTLCKIDSQWEFAVWLRELKQGLCDNLEGWDGEGGGRGHKCMADSYWCMTENHKIL